MRKNFPPLFSQGADGEGRPSGGVKKAIFLIVALIAVWFAISALPNPTPDQAAPVVTEETVTPSLIGPGYVIGLILLAGGALFALYLRSKAPGERVASHLRELGRLKTGPQQNIHLVACGDDVLLIGATPQQVTLLKQYPQELFDENTARATTATPEDPGEGFMHVLNRYSGVQSIKTNTLYPKRTGAS